MTELTHQQLQSLLDYEPETGAFRWKARSPEHFLSAAQSPERNAKSWNSKYAGKRCGSLRRPCCLCRCRREILWRIREICMIAAVLDEMKR